MGMKAQRSRKFEAVEEDEPDRSPRRYRKRPSVEKIGRDGLGCCAFCRKAVRGRFLVGKSLQLAGGVSATVNQIEINE